MNKTNLIKTAKFLFAIGVLYWMLQSGQLDINIIKNISTPSVIFVSLALGLLNLLIVNLRWMMLLKKHDFPSTLKDTFPLTLVGLFFSYIVPGGVGGDIVKGYYLAKKNQNRRLLAITSLLLDRLFGLYGMVVLAFFSCLTNITTISSNPTLIALFLGIVFSFVGMTFFFIVGFTRLHKIGILFMSKIPVIGGIGSRVIEALHAYGNKNLILTFKCVLLSLIAQVITTAFMINIGREMGVNLGFATYFFAVPLGFIATALPIAPAGIGVGQMAFLVLFNVFSGVKTLVGQTSITAFQLTQMGWGFMGAYFYTRLKTNVLNESSKKAAIPQESFLK